MTDLDIAFKIHSNIVNFWQFYMVCLSGVLGWVLSRQSPWSAQKRKGILMLAVVLTLFSIAGITNSTAALDEVVTAMKSCYCDKPDPVSMEVYKAMVDRLDFTANVFGFAIKGQFIHLIAHLLADVLVLYFIWVIAAKDPDTKKN